MRLLSADQDAKACLSGREEARESGVGGDSGGLPSLLDKAPLILL